MSALIHSVILFAVYLVNFDGICKVKIIFFHGIFFSLKITKDWSYRWGWERTTIYIYAPHTFKVKSTKRWSHQSKWSQVKQSNSVTVFQVSIRNRQRNFLSSHVSISAVLISSGIFGHLFSHKFLYRWITCLRFPISSASITNQMLQVESCPAQLRNTNHWRAHFPI